MTESDPDRIPLLSPLGDALERLVFTRTYRRFVVALLGVLTVLVALHAIRFVTTGVLDLTAASVGFLDVATSVAVTLFVVAGIIQVLLFARGVRRQQEMVAESAEAVEESADVLEATTEELEEHIDEAPPAVAPDIEETVETVAEKAEEAKETVEGVQSTLDPDERTERGGADDTT